MPLRVTYKNNELSLSHRGLDVLSKLSNKEKATSLLLANNLLEKELDKYVENIETMTDAHFLWIMTLRPLRLDDLEGLILYYYLLYIIKRLIKIVPFKSILLSKEFPNYVKDYLEMEMNIPTAKKKNWLYELKFELTNSLRPLKSLMIILSKSMVKPKIDSNSLWFITNSDFNLHRYRNFLENFQLENKVFIHASNMRDIYNLKNGDKSLNFASFFKVSDLKTILKRAYVLKRSAKLFHDFKLVSSFSRSITLSEVMVMMLRDVLIQRAFKKYKPKALFMTTANTYPPARLLSRQAYKQKIETVIVATRPMFTNLRPEERTCNSDLLAINDANIGDYFLVWDLFSKNTLIEQGIQKTKIFIDHSPVVQHKTYKYKLKSCILFLLSDSNTNDKLMHLIFELKKETSFNIAIKRHPGITENKDQTEQINKNVNKVIDLSDFKLDEIYFEDVIAISVDSSAGIEACSRGCGLIWLPFLNERSVIFYSVMKIIGSNYSTSAEFLKQMQLCYSKRNYRKEFIQHCSDNYKEHFVADTDSQHLISLLKLSK